MSRSSRIIFIFGGIKSGKSQFLLNIVCRMKKNVTYIATAERVDDEMKEKIELHRQSRPKEWQTIEETKNITSALDTIKNDVIIIECLTTYISNLMFNNKDVLKEVKELLDKTLKLEKCVFIVSNEVGHCLVPDNKLGRDFINIVGQVNQEVAKIANEVYFVKAGIADRLK
ncbi:MAG: bifunctional adenosylcobinamide kinase/adenosylcobinamide-phosphate guanylyltransferase [bacterium]|nr:bifunctional adenosylcobinamide kinase/adenosylcobinamide-phosphate guanylyltransferase [bacterium]